MTAGAREIRMLVDALIAIDDIDSHAFNSALFDLQCAIDVDDGGYASVFFDDLSDSWCDSTPDERRAIISEYIGDEGRMLDEAREDMEAS